VRCTGGWIGQNRDDRAKVLAVKLVAVLAEVNTLAPAERLDVFQRPLDRPVAHVDAANIAQIDFAGRAGDRLQAGDDPRRAHFLARPVFGFPSAPLLLSRLTRCDFFGRRLASR
jgi:hypothetical protein